MKKLMLLLMMSLVPASVLAEENISEPIRPAMFCGGLSDSRCFSKPINSICTRDPRSGQVGICRPIGNTLDEEAMTCACV